MFITDENIQNVKRDYFSSLINGLTLAVHDKDFVSATEFLNAIDNNQSKPLHSRSNPDKLNELVDLTHTTFTQLGYNLEDGFQSIFHSLTKDISMNDSKMSANAVDYITSRYASLPLPATGGALPNFHLFPNGPSYQDNIKTDPKNFRRKILTIETDHVPGLISIQSLIRDSEKEARNQSFCDNIINFDKALVSGFTRSNKLQHLG